MTLFPRTGLLAVVFVLGVSTYGCSSKQSAPSASAESGSSSAQPEPDVDRELAKLPEDDRKLAAIQKTCPVTGEALGSMGVPIKVAIDGRSFFICCAGCRKEAQKNFDDYIAKLDKPGDTESK
jgi:hypothetical protein